MDGITDTVNHRIIGIVEQSELKFNHILILRIESGNIYKSLKIANLISLFESKFSIKSFLGIDVQIRINADTANIFTQVFFIDGRVTVTLSEAGADKAVISQLIVQSGTEYGTERNFCPEYLSFRFSVVVGMEMDGYEGISSMQELPLHTVIREELALPYPAITGLFFRIRGHSEICLSSLCSTHAEVRIFVL